MDSIQSSLSSLEKAVAENPNDSELLLKLASLYVKSDSLKNAVSALEKSLELNASLYAARYLLACAYSRGNAFAYAFREFQKIVDEDGDFCFDRIDFSSLPDCSSASKAWESYGFSEGNSPDRLFSAGFALFAMNENEKSLGFFKRCMSLNPKYGSVNFFAALVSYDMEDYSSAWNYFQQDASVRPQSASTLYYLGMVCMKRGNFKQALPFFQKAISIKNGYVKAIYSMGKAYLELGLLVQAEKCFRQLLIINAKFILPSALYDLGGICLKQGKKDEALSLYEQSVREDPSFFRSNIRIGEIKKDGGDLDSAFEYFQKAFDSSSGDPDAVCSLCSIMLARRQYREASDELGRVFMSHPDHALSLRLLGEAMMGLEDFKSALDMFRRAIDSEPSDASLRRLAGTALLRIGNYEEAEAELKKAVEMEPDDAEARCLLGMAYSEAEKTRESMDEFWSSVKASKDPCLEYFAEGASCLALGETDAASVAFKKASSAIFSSGLKPAVSSAIQMLAVSGAAASRRSGQDMATYGGGDDSRLFDFLIRAVDGRDGYSFAHSLRVAKISRRLAERICEISRDLLSEEEIKCIEMAGLFHDIGMLSVPSSVVAKRSPLTEDEFSQIREHCTEGEKLIASLNLPWDIGKIVRHHHEKINGKGYPDKLSGDDIPLGSMIISVADMFEALVSDRPYRQSFSFEKAVTLLNKRQGNDFAPGLVKAFIDIVPDVSRIIADIR